MKKKQYMSMQEELAARRAAAEKAEIVDALLVENTDRTASGHFERTSPAGRRKQAAARPSGSTSRLGQTAARMSKNSGALGQASGQLSQLLGRLEQFVQEPGPGKYRRRPEKTTSRKRTYLQFLVGLMIAVAAVSLAVGFLASDRQDEYGDGTSWQDDPTEATWNTETPAPSEGDLNETTSMTELEAYAAEYTQPNPDEQSLFGGAYSRIDRYITEVDSECNWYINEGCIYIWPKCDKGDDPEEVADLWGGVTETINEIIMDEGVEDTPVIIPIRDRDGWKNLMILVDGTTVFISEELRE